MMNAIQFQTFGNPDMLNYLALARPAAEAGSAIIQVKSASVNPSDVVNISGHFEHTQLPRIPGRDFSGVVVDGPAAWLGAEVWGTGGDIGFTRDGSHAEFIRIPVAALVRKPASLSHEQASAIGVNFIAAWLGTVEYAQLRAGETIAVLGASGGVGGAVTQIAKALGCTVIGIDRVAPADNSPTARLLDEYLPLDESAQRRIQALGGVDVVYNAAGGTAFEFALGLVKRRGRVVVISASGKRRVDFDLIDFYHNETRLIGVDSAKLGVAESAPLMAKLVDGFDSGRYEAPVIAQRYTLQEARQAYAAVAAGTRGRVVINM
jgi:NADPH2:quinone reductase